MKKYEIKLNTGKIFFATAKTFEEAVKKIKGHNPDFDELKIVDIKMN